MLDVRKAVVAGLGFISLLAVVASPAGARAAAGSPALFNREEYQASPATLRTDARRYSVMVMWSDAGRFVRVLHRLNPRLQILMYQNVPFSTLNDPTAGMNCTTVPQDLAHPGWLARTAAGAPIAVGGAYSTNPGNRGYQQACIGHAVALAKRGGFNGIFLDGVTAKFSWTLPHGTTLRPVQFPSDAAYQAAVYSLISYGGPAVRASGLKLFANVSAPGSAVWRKWNGPLDGAMEEGWTDGGLGTAQQAPWWKEKLANAAWSEAHRKYLLLHSYSSGEQANAYGLAAMLLVANGHTSYSTSNSSLVGGVTWYPEYTAAERLGRPLGGYRVVRGGVYVRRFRHGIVVVNPTLHGVRRVALRGRYSGAGVRRARSVALGPLSALILARTG